MQHPFCRRAAAHSLKMGTLWMLLSLLGFMQAPVKAQTQLSAFRPGLTTEGAVYFLPTTAVRISVLVEKSTYTPGDFAPFAQRYLRMADVSQEPSVSYRIVGITQTAVPVADTTKAYVVKFNPRTVAARVTLSDDSRLLGLNVDDAVDAAIPQPFTPAPRQPLVNPRQYMNEEILSCGSTAKMAELTANEVYDLRENRTLLIKGQADFMPHDGEQMKLMLLQLEKQEQSLASMFLGVTLRDTTEHVLWVHPDSTMSRQMLFRLSQVRGLVDTDDLSGAPYYITIDNRTQLPATDQAAAMKPKKQVAGIYVNVPGQLRSTIYEGIEPLNTANLPAPQFGHTLLLSADLFNKRFTTRLWLDPLTGAIDRIDGEQLK